LVYPDISSTPGFKHQLVGLLALFYTQVFPHHPTGLQKVCKNSHSSLGSPKMQQFTLIEPGAVEVEPFEGALEGPQLGQQDLRLWDASPATWPAFLAGFQEINTSLGVIIP
jgi:hypothetical protein